jgi:hypothetical protein
VLYFFIRLRRSAETWRAVLFGLVLIGAGALVSPGTVQAGDYAHTCRSANGDFVMDDEELRAAADAQSGGGKSIKYRVLQTIVLHERKGYCISKHRDAKGAKFTFVSKTYVLKISFRHQGYPITTHMICELDASGLPASFSCGKTVVTTDFTLQPK